MRVCLFIALIAACPAAYAHKAEPISTEFARPFEVGAGNIKVGYSRESTDDRGTLQTLPEAEIEFGILPRFQINLGFPLTRMTDQEGAAITAGGHLETGARFLFFQGHSYAVSVQGSIESPTGSTRLFGDAVIFAPGLFSEKNFGAHFRLHSNLSWRASVSGKSGTERVFEYHHAVVWFAAKHFIPVVEFLGATDTRDGRTEFAVQPEAIIPVGTHVELKAGVPLGTTKVTPSAGFRAQLAFHW